MKRIESVLSGAEFFAKAVQAGLVFLLVWATVASGTFAQAQGPPQAPKISAQMTIRNDLGDVQRLALGLDPAATAGVDAQFGEEEEKVPPSPPRDAEIFFARLIGEDVSGVNLPDDGMLVDVRKEGSFPVERTYEIKLQDGADQGGTSASKVIISWKLPDGVSGKIQSLNADGTTNSLIDGRGMSGCGSVTLTGFDTNLRKALLTLTYEGKSQPNGEHRLKVCGTDGTGNDSGWRLLVLPSDATRADLEDDIGETETGFSVNGGNLLHKWKGGADGWSPVESSSADLSRGEGFIMYFFDDSVDPLTSEGLTLDVPAGPEDQRANFTAGNLNTGHRFSLLGNPYNTAFSLGALGGEEGLPGSGYQATVQVWSPETGRFEPMTQGVTDGESPEVLSAWQGFFVERSPSGTPASSLTFDANGRRAVPSDLVGGRPGGKSIPEKQATVEMSVEGEGSEEGSLQDGLKLLFSERSSLGWDAYEATQLSAPRAEAFVTLTSPLRRKGKLARRTLASEPYPNRTEPASVPLSVEGTGIDGSVTLRWPEAAQDQVPEDWTVELEDTQTGSHVDLRSGGYDFDLSAGDGASLSGPEEARFRLHVVPGSSIPVELSGFSAQATGEGAVRLTWQTASETENAGFYVQRREGTRGQEDEWTQVGFVEGAGTTSALQSYRFTDVEVPFEADRLTYRLRQVDTDGSESLSRLVTVRRGAPNWLVLKGPIPNPISGQATVHLGMPEAMTVQMAVYDLLGRRVETLASGHVDAGRHERRLDVGSWAGGMYFLRLKAGKESKTRKFTVVR